MTEIKGLAHFALSSFGSLLRIRHEPQIATWLSFRQTARWTVPTRNLTVVKAVSSHARPHGHHLLIDEHLRNALVHTALPFN